MSDFYFIVGASKPSRGISQSASALCMLGDQCDYSHIHIEFPAGTFQEASVFFEARRGEVNFINETTFGKEMETVRRYVVPCDQDQIHDALMFCWKYCGIKYGFLELAGACIAKAASYLGKEIANPFGDKMKTEICSGLAARLIQLAGIEIIGDIESKSPHDIINICETAGFARVEV